MQPAFAMLALITLYGIAQLASHSGFSYKKVHWVFQVAHFFAGAILALFFSSFSDNPWQIICLVVCVGFVWEVTEYYLSISPLKLRFLNKKNVTLPDSLADLALDAMGAISLVFLFPLF